MQTEFLTKAQAAELLGITVRGLESLMAKRLIPYYKLGRRTVRFKKSVLLAYLEARCLVAPKGYAATCSA